MKKNILDEFGLTKDELRKLLIAKKTKKPQILTRYVTDKVFKFGIISDTHLCSNEERLDELHTYYAICKKVGVNTVFHAGDLIAGWGVYSGQEAEVHTFGAQGQADYVVDKYPRVRGITTYFITGNHCLSFFKRSGIDIGDLVAAKRPDMKYLGQCGGKVIINNLRIELLHPDGGGAYAISYKGQKIAEKIMSGHKPDVLILGHAHTSNYFFYRNIHIFNAGCFEGQTLFLKRKGINPAIGGWICEARLGRKQDRLIGIQQTWIPFFD